MGKKKRGLERHSAEQQKQYEREARLQYGPDRVNPTVQRWNSCSKDQQDAIIEEGSQIYAALADAMQAGKRSGDREVQQLLARWQNHLRHFYEPDIDTLRGLGQMYNSHPDFIAAFQNIHADLPAYLERVIDEYVDDLETAEIERMLAEDKDMENRLNNLSL